VERNQGGSGLDCSDFALEWRFFSNVVSGGVLRNASAALDLVAENMEGTRESGVWHWEWYIR